VDNSSTHSTPAAQVWLAAHPRVHRHFTPTGASWLHLVEAWFSILARKSVRRGSFDTVRASIRHIEHYIPHWNEYPTPFVCTKEPADVIKKAIRQPVHEHDFTVGTLGPARVWGFESPLRHHGVVASASSETPRPRGSAITVC
jgi:hypothetical protein